MPTSSTPRAPRAAKSPPVAPPPVKPFLRFYHSEELREKTLAVLTTLEEAPDPTRHRKALSDMVMQLTDGGLEYYFLRPLDLANTGFVTKQSAHLGMSGVRRVLDPVVHNIIGRMSKEELLIVSGHIRQLME